MVTEHRTETTAIKIPVHFNTCFHKESGNQQSPKRNIVPRRLDVECQIVILLNIILNTTDYKT